MSEFFEFKKNKQQEAFESETPQFEHSVETYQNVLFWSFMLSQGDPQSQKIILDYVVDTVGCFNKDLYEHAQVQFANKYFSRTDLELSPAMLRFHAELKHPPKVTESEYDMLYTYDTSTPLRILKYQLSIMEEPPTLSTRRTIRVAALANRTWYNDMKYLAKGGRPRKDMSGTKDTLRDPWFSFGVHYLVRKNSTGIPLIDKLLFETSASYPLATDSSRKTKVHRLRIEDIEACLTVYNSHHSDTFLTAQERDAYLNPIRNHHQSQ